MKSGLKTLSGLVAEDGPVYYRLRMAMRIWKEAYEKRGLVGDEAVIKFLEHFGELK